MRNYTYSINSDRTQITLTMPDNTERTRDISGKEVIFEANEVQTILYNELINEYETNGATRYALELLVDISTASFDEE